MRKRISARALGMLLFPAFAALLLGPAIAFAADADIEVLKQQIKALSEQVQALEVQLKKLERQPPPAAQAAGAAVPALREAWRGIKDGLTQDEVRKRLGKPRHEFTLSGKQVWYYYYPGIGGGSVFYGNDRRVVASQSPPLNPWGF